MKTAVAKAEGRFAMGTDWLIISKFGKNEADGHDPARKG